MAVTVLGNGVWGNALHSVIQQNDPSVTIAKRDEKVTSDIVVLSIPTQSIRSALENVSFGNNRGIIINTAKGIEESTHLLPNQIIQSHFTKGVDYYTLIGPGFAHEVVDKMPTLVNIGYLKKNDHNEKIKALFQTDFFRVRLTTGVETLELSAAFKNIYATVCGLAHGMGYKENTRVKLMVLAIEEMSTLSRSLNLPFDTEITAGTIGDLVLTCNSQESRNFRFGVLLATYSVKDALSKIQSTVEGYFSMRSVEYFKKRAKTELPLATFVTHIVKENNPKAVKASFDNFIKFT